MEHKNPNVTIKTNQVFYLTLINTLLLRNYHFFYEQIEKTTKKYRLILQKRLPLHYIFIYIGWNQKI